MQELYELDIAQDVGDYLITNRQLASALVPDPSLDSAREKLLIREHPGGLDLSLYLAADLLDNLLQDNPLDRIGPGNLEDFCLALEGVSHFVYLVWNATGRRSVSPVEMELQAEVDKFVMLWRCLEQSGNSPSRGELARILFRAWRLRDGLGMEEQQRYRRANRYAERYCLKLESLYFQARRGRELLNELRRFYRIPRRQKFDYIARAY